MENLTQEKQTPFTPPRHWVGPEQLKPEYWQDASVQERRSQEFFDKPIETIALIDKLDQKGFARREFLTIMGASMAMASLSCARRPVNKIIPYVIQPEEITPGVASWYASSMPETGAGILIKTREGRPIKLEGNPDHPLNRGALSARGQAAVLDLYDPERIRDPQQRSRGGSAGQAIGWNEVDQRVAAQLKGGGVRLVTGQSWGESSRQLIQDFLGAVGSGSGHVEFDALGLEALSQAQQECYGTAVTPAYSFDEAEVVVSLGADFLGTWLSPLEHARDWAARRKLDGQKPAQAHMSKFFCFEPMMTITGANADERIAIRPGDELKIAMALIHELVFKHKTSGVGVDSSVLEDYRAETVAAEIGFDAEILTKVAAALLRAQGKSLIVAQSRSKDALALQVAVNLLNSILGNEGKTVDGTANPGLRGLAGFSAMSKLIEEMKAGQVKVLILHGVNPAYTLPASLGFAEATGKVPLVISVAESLDETGELSDLVLPDHHFLENWGDSRPRKGVYALQQPAIHPLHNSRAFQDNLIAWMKGVGATPKAANWHEYLRANWRERISKEARSNEPFDVFWENALRDGVVKTADASAKSSPRSFKGTALAKLPKYEAATGLRLVLYPSVGMHDGRQANNAWLQELPDPISTLTWDNCLSIAPRTAKEAGLQTNDVVAITSDAGTVEVPVLVQPGMHPSAAAVAVGYGRRTAGKVGTGVGVDVTPLVQAAGGTLVLSGEKISIRKTGRIYRLATTQWHHQLHGENEHANRPILNDITLAEYKANPAAQVHTDPHLRLEKVPTMWPVHEYKGYRWGMAIDLNSCIGCQACVMGCQAENNIPVVGRDNVRRSREMHWIRIDRYYSGSEDNPDVAFEPMLCQHCENAPCETVCPVLATVHDTEGTSNQAYNRCVGTRYCQNNCPYKVRRFNFFDHWKSYEETKNLVWNPDVTVRTRGIMEKCSFCIQRISHAKDVAKDEGRKVKDGDFKTACQQTCPTDAIVFGNLNDPESRVSKLRADARSFHVLEVLNTRPSVTYLTKVRNKEATGSEHGGGHHS